MSPKGTVTMSAAQNMHTQRGSSRARGPFVVELLSGWCAHPLLFTPSLFGSWPFKLRQVKSQPLIKGGIWYL